MIVAVRKAETGEFIHNPTAEQVIKAGDVLITMGDMDKIVALRRLAQAK